MSDIPILMLAVYLEAFTELIPNPQKETLGFLARAAFSEARPAPGRRSLPASTFTDEWIDKS